MVILGRLIVKLVPTDFAATIIAGGAVGAVLQVTPSLVLSFATGVTRITLLAVTAVSLITQVPADAVAEQENAPAIAEPQATSDGEAFVPAAAQFDEES